MKPTRTSIEEHLVDALSMLASLAAVGVALYLQITLSNLVTTEWEALFISMCAFTSLSLFNIAKWRLPAILILLVAAFPATKYETLHYIWAILFFIIAYYKILIAKRYNWLALTLIPGCAILLQKSFSGISLLYFEAIAIPTIVIYHTCYLILRLRISKKRQKSSHPS